MAPDFRLSLTFAEVYELFQLDPFGIATFARQVKDEIDAFSLAIHSGLVNVRVPPLCSVCGLAKSLTRRMDRVNNASQGLYWICPYATRQQNCQRITISSNTWFEKVHITWLRAFELTLHWFFESPVSSAAGQIGVSKECAVDWYSYCREVCYTVVSKLDICIGGPGFHVEIDESHLFKRKYRQGRLLAHENVWVFGGICRETKEIFVQYVPDRTGTTLWPIIQHRIHPGTIILTDSARVYDNLHEARRGGYAHFQVNHKENFVDPNNPTVYTNTIERQWGLIKGKIKGTLNNIQLDMYLGEYMYRKMFLQVSTDRERKTLGNQFKVFLDHVKETYPGP